MRAFYANVRVCAETGQIQPILPDLYRCRESQRQILSPQQKGQEVKFKFFIATAIIMAATASSQPASAIDCSKAKSENEKAICADPNLLSADEAMNKAYRAVLQIATEPNKTKIVLAQRLWNGSNTADCSTKNNRCLENLIDRTTFLSGKPKLGEAVFPLPIPYVDAEEGVSTNSFSTTELLKFLSPSSPAEIAFNKYVDEKWSSNDEPDLTQDSQSWESRATLIFANSNMLGASYSSAGYSGGAHGNWWNDAVYFNRRTGQRIEFNDVFKAGAQDILLPLCRSQADEPLGVEDDELTNLKVAIGNLSRWQFTPEGAELIFPPYSIGGYVQSLYGCSMKSE